MDKVSELTDEQLNRLLHEKVMGECWHKTEPFGTIQSGGYECRKCSKVFPTHCPPEFSKDEIDGRPDYCQDLNAVAKAEAKVIDAGTLYFTCLRGVVGDNDAPVKWVTATARQRAEAVAIAMRLAEI